MSIKMSVEFIRNISVILTGDYKHTSKISKYKISYHLYIALFSCRKCNQEVYFKLMKPQMFSL